MEGRIANSLWNLYAGCYDAIAKLTPYQDMMARVCKELKLKPAQRILDAGCGTGNLEVWIDSLGIPVQMGAVDFSQAMLKRAKLKCKRLSKVKIKFSYIDLNEGLSSPDSYFDAVVCINTLYALNDPQKTLNEFADKLKKGGQLIIINPCSQNFLAIFLEHLKQIWKRDRLTDFLITGAILPFLLLVALINLIIVDRASKGKYHFFSTAELKKLVEATEVKVKKVVSIYANTVTFIKAIK
jgi:ubiquinone/menaquinone biosynthesis C-methylase UbiE